MPITVQQQVPSGATFTAPARGIEASPRISGATFTSTSLHPYGLTPLVHLDSRFINGLDGTNPTDETAISQWNDISGNNRHFVQPTQANRPLFRTASRNMLTFDQATVESSTTGWANYFNSPITRGSTVSKHGIYSAIMTAGGAGTNDFGVGPASYTAPINTSAAFPVTPGQTYTAVGSLRAATVARSGQLRIGWYKSDGTASATAVSTSSAVNDSTSAWVDYSVTATVPSDAAFAIVYFRILAAAASEVHYADCVGFWPGTSTVWVPPVVLPNNQPVVQFEAGNLPTGSAMYNDAIPTTAVGTAYFVVYHDAILGYPFADGINPGPAENRTNFFLSSTSGGQFQVSAGTPQNNTTAAAVRQAHVFSAVVNGASSVLSTNGTAQTLNIGTNPMVAASGGFGINGYQTSGAQRNDMSVMAVILYSGAHDTTTRQQIERSLGPIYGITVV